MAQSGQLLGRKQGLHIGLHLAHGQAPILHPHQILLLHLRILANQLACHPTVLGEHQQAHRVDVQAASGGQAHALAWDKAGGRAVVAPAVLRLDQVDGGGVAVFGLAADKAHGFVQDDGDLFVLLAPREFVHLDAVQGADRFAQHRHLAIHLDPALGDPVVGLAARAQAEFGHAFVQSGCGVAHGVSSVWLRKAVRLSTRTPP